MSAVSKFLDKKFLKSLEPLDRLSTDKLDEIISKSSVENLPAGRTLFRQGERDSNVLYLLSGQIELLKAGSTKTEIIKAKSSETNYPLANQLPRPCTAKTKTATSVLYIDSSLLEILLDDNPSGEYVVTEIGMADEATDWMMKFLQSRAFLSMPTDNIQNLLMRMEEIPVKAGQTIIQQGESGDYYYVINQGKCVVTRRPAPSAEDIRLAELGIGNGFGEEALITGGNRNATITMLTDGILMRLGKEDFKSILVEPLLETIDIQTVISQKSPSTTVIDVRSKNEFAQKTLPGAISIPLSMLRLRITTLDLNREYLSYSDNGKDSSAAAFLLSQHGISCRIIKGNLASLASQPIKHKSTKSGVEKNRNSVLPSMPSRKKTGSKQNSSTTTSSTSTNVERLHKTANKIHAQADQLVSQTDHREAPSVAKTPTTDNKSAARPITPGKPKVHVVTPDPVQLARKESEKILAEAKNIKQAALREASRLRQAITSNVSSLEAKETAKLRQQLEATRQKAEAAIKQNEQLAEQMRQQAEQESENILQQARQEAEQLKAEIQSFRDKADQEQLEIKQHIESEIKEAKLRATEEARLLAGKEAELQSKQIIEQARREAEQLKSEIQALRDKADQEQQEIKKQIEFEIKTAKQRATEEARLLAGKEAELQSKQIIEQARLEAEQLKSEVQALHDKAEQEQLAIQNRIETEISTVKQRAAEEARLLAEKEAAEIKKNALEEANQIKAALQHTKQLLEKQVKQKTQKTTTISHDNVFDLDGDVISPPARKFETDEVAAKQMAINIKKRLDKTEQKRKIEEAKYKKAKSTIRKLKDRTILESESDIFVFKFPGNTDKQTKNEEPIPRAQTQKHDIKMPAQREDGKKTTDELIILKPAPESKPQAQAEQQTEQPEQVSNNMFDLIISPNHESERYAYQERQKKKSFVAAAASILLIVVLSGVAYTTQIQFNFTEVSAVSEPGVAELSKTMEDAERKVRHDAEIEFERKLSRLK